MKTNDIKKGYILVLTGDRSATMMDNKKGNIRMVEVHATGGSFNEMGSVYAWDILTANGKQIELTAKQRTDRVTINNFLNAL